MKKYSPFLICTALLLVFVALLEMQALHRTGGHFCYPLDDAFIHMSVAKNLAVSHVWGVTNSGWVSTSSSPFYTLVLTLSYIIVGVNIYSPFIISLLGGILVMYALSRELNNNSTLTNQQKILVMIVTMILAVIPSLSLSGMEHTLQISFTLFFVHAAATYIVSDDKKISFWPVAMLAALMVFTRYENVFLVGSVCGILLLRKKIAPAFLIGAASIVPVVLFGIFFYSKGGFPIPNSVLIKGNTNFKSIAGGQISLPALSMSLGGILIVACLVAYDRMKRGLYDRDFYLVAIFIITTFFHSVFAQFGWFFRYEAYLIVLAVSQLLKMFLQEFNWKEWRKPATLIFGAFTIVMCSNLVLRVANAQRKTAGAIHNIYDQQYQMGKFVEEYYNGQAIAANDIGAISYFGDIKTLDLWGLANNEVTKARKDNYYNTAFLRELVKKNDTKLIMIYDSWFKPDISQDWVKVARWYLPYNVICGDDMVTFYAPNAAAAGMLKQNLLQYAETHLPKENRVEYYR